MMHDFQWETSQKKLWYSIDIKKWLCENFLSSWLPLSFVLWLVWPGFWGTFCWFILFFFFPSSTLKMLFNFVVTFMVSHETPIISLIIALLYAMSCFFLIQLLRFFALSLAFNSLYYLIDLWGLLIFYTLFFPSLFLRLNYFY